MKLQFLLSLALLLNAPWALADRVQELEKRIAAYALEDIQADPEDSELMQTLLEKFLHLQSLLLEQNAETRLISLHDSRCVCTSC